MQTPEGVREGKPPPVGYTQETPGHYLTISTKYMFFCPRGMKIKNEPNVAARKTRAFPYVTPPPPPFCRCPKKAWLRSYWLWMGPKDAEKAPKASPQIYGNFRYLALCLLFWPACAALLFGLYPFVGYIPAKGCGLDRLKGLDNEIFTGALSISLLTFRDFLLNVYRIWCKIWNAFRDFQ